MEKSYSSMYQNFIGEKFKFFDIFFQNRQNFFYLEPGLCLSITDFVDAESNFFKKRHNHSESCITVKVSRRTQKVEIYLAKEGSGFGFLVQTRETFSVAMLARNLE